MKIFHLAMLAVLLGSCSRKEETLILVSKDNGNRITQWLHNSNKQLVIKEFYILQADSMDYYLQLADGIVIGGGEDIHPSIYGKEEFVEVCEDFDLFRDSIETLMIKYAMENKIPLLGICRGHQIINAVCGGTLIPDIPSFLETEIVHRTKGDSAHYVVLSENSWLAGTTEKDTLWVNSRHHQCAGEVAPGFGVVALSPDSVIEAIVFSDTLRHPFAAGIQWHPENLKDEASMKIAGYFLNVIGRKNN